MTFNKYSVYSAISGVESKNNKDFDKVLELIDKLYHFDDEMSVKTYLKDNYGIQNDIMQFAIMPNAIITTKTGQKYFNVLIEYDKKVKSFNFNKGVN